jgi:hypothetical protein
MREMVLAEINWFGEIKKPRAKKAAHKKPRTWRGCS